MSRLPLARAGLTLAVVLTACAPPPPEPPALDLAGAETAVRDSLEKARVAVMASPESARAWGRLGMVADAHGFDDVALPCYRRARELDPGNVRWPYFLARLLLLEGVRVEEVVALLTEVVARDPGYAPARLRLAEAYLQLGAAAEAESSFRRALELDDALVTAHLGVGQLALEGGRTDEAVAQLERARDLDPDDASVLSTLGRAYRLAGRLEEARATAALAGEAEGRPRYADPWLEEIGALGVSSSLVFERALSRIRGGDFQRAIPELEAVARSRPRDPYVRAELGGAYQAVGRAEDAARAFGEAVALKDDWVDARLQLVGLLLDLNRAGEAAGHLRRLEPLAEERPLIQGYIALALSQQGRLAEAAARFARAAEKSPLPPQLQAGWGLALAQLGRVAEAESRFREALAGMPRSAQIHLYLGLALEAQGRIPEALGFYRQSMDLEPSPLAAERIEALER